MLELGVRLSALLSSARAFMAQTASSFEPALAGASFQILQRLHSVGPTRAMRIAEALAMDRSALSRLLRQLTEAGLIEAHLDPLDGRATVYGLTQSAQERMDIAMGDKGHRFLQRLEDWSIEDIRLLSSLLDRLTGSMGA